MKKLFIGLLVVIGISLNFGSCEVVFTYTSQTFPAGGGNVVENGNSLITCIKPESNCGNMEGNFGTPMPRNYSLNYLQGYDDGNALFYCITGGKLDFYVQNSCTFTITRITSLEYTSQQCQSTYNLVPSSDLSSCQSDLSSCQTSYSGCMNSFNSHNCQALFNLIPIESVDTNYCQINNLCPGSSIPCVGSGSSNFYIFKDSRYIPITGTTNIFVNLPEFLDYSYEYSNGGDDLDIDLNYNVDTEYIDGIIRTQNYKPTTEDFTNLVGMLAPYSKYLIFLVFIFIIWAWIKKPFKSKKL